MRCQEWCQWSQCLDGVENRVKSQWCYVRKKHGKGFDRHKNECQDHCKNTKCPGGLPPPCPDPGEDECGQWSQWSHCDKTCDSGAQQSRSRVCKGNKENETKACGWLPRCHTECKKGCCKWEDWGDCTRTCGGGYQYRFCSSGQGMDKEMRECNTLPCGHPPTYPSPTPPPSCEWSEWGHCSATCGHGEQTRECKGGVSHGSNMQTRSCEQAKCHPDPTPSPWPHEII